MKNKSETIGDMIVNCRPEVGEALRKLFEQFGTFENILSYKESGELYCKIMAHVIYQRELEVHNYEFDYNTWKFKTRPFEEVKKIYGGTVVWP
jgi:hypothetical protein